PYGRQFTRISAPDDLTSSTTSTSASLETGTTPFRYLPIPSRRGPLFTVTPSLGTLEILGVLFGFSWIATAKSLPTFLDETSKADTNSIESGVYPPILPLVRPASL